jgi:GT2 family glycosyltransferase
VVLGIGGIAGHIFKHEQRHANGYFYRLLVPQNYSAVTGACMMVHRDAFNRLGGFDENLPEAFNDVDFSIRLIKAGYDIVWTPHAELYHYESVSRGSDLEPDKIEAFRAAIAYMEQQHADILFQDFAFNPNLSLNLKRILWASPPRVKKPWQQVKQ